MRSLQFATEQDLQDFCVRVLKSKGLHPKTEVWNGSVRADIVTSEAVIECKRYLNREALYQALGQAKTYQGNLGRKQIWIVGQSPVGWQEKEQAIKIAEEIEKVPNVIVSFIDEDDYWQEESLHLIALWRYALLILGSTLILSAFQAWTKSSCTPQFSNSRHFQSYKPLSVEFV
jgi:hypothetical protein